MAEGTSVSSSNILGLNKPVIVIVGPTASGKSALAQSIALDLDGEVVSADSMQIYKGMDIGTGKLLPQDQYVPHYGFDLLELGNPFSAALFQRYARDCIKDIDERGKWPLLCGGTGFYIRSVIDGYDFPAGEQEGNEIRDIYNAYAEENGAQALWELLKGKDPVSAELIAPQDIKRVVRAFELLEDNTTYAVQKEKLMHIPQVVPAVSIGLKVDVEALNARIDARVDAMIEEGLVDEVRKLLAQGFKSSITASQAIGYKELVLVIEGELTLDEAIQNIKIATHRYAKRQRTWFRRDKRIQWIDANVFDIETLTKDALAIIRTMRL